VVVSSSRNHIITARTHTGLLGLQASVTAKGVAPIKGHSWQSPEALALTCETAGQSVSLVDAGEQTERFDILPLPIATDGAQLRMRCVMTTLDPDTLQQDLRVLRKIVKEASGNLALDCAVAAPGVLREGDPIILSL